MFNFTVFLKMITLNKCYYCFVCLIRVVNCVVLNITLILHNLYYTSTINLIKQPDLSKVSLPVIYPVNI